eukprot:TRINITY_DN11484_c0_g6_i1.p1 TRINITY_DN11484_c0_g6~~TRINITY_DN11484_c0_g6_i1.p1  ORF type:complete len:476 (+),score=75.33 TRINITY_DN11484_c0_g6_i1:84-1511(+)
MGCASSGRSGIASPAAASAPVSTETPARASGTLSAASSVGSLRSSASSTTLNLASPEDVALGKVSIQIKLDGGWRTCGLEEATQIKDHLAAGESKFQIQARGQAYIVDAHGDDGPQQTNVASGRSRPLRFLAVTGDDAGADTDAASAATAEEQRTLGPQSLRGGASKHPLSVLEAHPHAQECFRAFEANELRLCGEYAVFYHSYSFAALLYEVNAAVGSVLFRFRSQYATLPRILVHEFERVPDANALADLFNKELAGGKRDHDPRYRAVGLSVMCSLVSTGPEACIPMVFVAGYSCKDLSFINVLENLLVSCYVPKKKARALADRIVDLSEEHGLDVTQFGGKPCKSGQAGHLLQIFIKRNLVDQLTYAAKPYGFVDEERMPISRWVNGNNSVAAGQARIVAHPRYFMQANCVRMYVASADATFHGNRKVFQSKLIDLLKPILGDPALRTKAATGIYGGSLPPWWSAEDQRSKA